MGGESWVRSLGKDMFGVKIVNGMGCDGIDDVAKGLKFLIADTCDGKVDSSACACG